jgi:hypothetical protein
MPPRMKRALAFAVLVLGCASTESKPVRTTSITIAPPSPFAQSDRVSIATLHREGDTVTAWWSHDSNVKLELPSADARAVLHDVTRDGKPELVVFGKSETWIVGVSPTKKPARMWRLEAQTLGATDEASLDAELAIATLGTTTTSPVKLVARLALATPPEMKALVGARGVKLCKRQGTKKSCTTTIAQASIDAALASKIALHGGQIATFEPADGEFGLQIPSCDADKDPSRITCIASSGGPDGGQWIFEKTVGGLRLAEVWSWAEDS